MDIDPFGHGNPHFEKPYGQGWDFDDCKITEGQVEAVEGLTNTRGEQLFRWLGWLIGDTMHFEGQVMPSRTQVDWGSLPPRKDDVMSLLPMRWGDGGPDNPGKKEDVRLLQFNLNEAHGSNLSLDGVYGDSTAAIVRQFYPRTDSLKDGKTVVASMWGDMEVTIAQKNTRDQTARNAAAKANTRIDGLSLNIPK